MAYSTYDVACLLMFSVEFYHMIAHIMIMCGVRTLPRKDLVRIRFYFLVDALSVFTSSFLVTGKLRWLAGMQIVQHMFYFLTWERSYMAKRIVDWSSLDWFKSSKLKETQMDSMLGTLFDVVVHMAMMYVIGEQMQFSSIIFSMILSQAALYIVIFNPKFAWSSPSRMPAWVEKRIGKLALE